MAKVYTVEELLNATEEWKENLKQTDWRELDNFLNQLDTHISGSQNL